MNIRKKMVRGPAHQRRDVLLAIKEGNSKPTNIMYATRMNYGAVKRTLAKLVEQGVAVYNHGWRGDRIYSRLYRLTEQGEEACVKLEELEWLWR